MDATQPGQRNRTLGATGRSPVQPAMRICLDTAHAGKLGKPRPITAMHAHVASHRELLVHRVWICDMADTYHGALSLTDLLKEPTRAPSMLGQLTRSGVSTVSGATLCAAGQQLLGAITHLYLGVPLDCGFVVHYVDVGAPGVVHKRAPIDMQVRVVPVTPRMAEARCTFDADLLFQQEGRMISVGRSSFTVEAPPIERVLMSRQYNPGI